MYGRGYLYAILTGNRLLRVSPYDLFYCIKIFCPLSLFGYLYNLCLCLQLQPNVGIFVPSVKVGLTGFLLCCFCLAVAMYGTFIDVMMRCDDFQLLCKTFVH